ncbi:MAG: acyl-ACP--UDP-N-acetylglucosamine O-acyltransferase [Acidobacteriota bacterium]|nr:acyl-ACP--UDP-N-acetylglucosamine O-acyltransferase [Thermoanaerobaculaceae bacterium]
MVKIDKFAVVESGAEIGEGTEIGPFSYIGKDVKIGKNCKIGPNCVISGNTEIGNNNVFVSHAAVGGPPQDIGYKGEETRLLIGDNNIFREFVTINRATTKENKLTQIGSNCLLMAYVHIAHDCQVGNNIIFANNATLAGHVKVGSFSTVGALSAVHQFCTVGEHAFIGGGSILTRDVLPFVKTVGSRGEGKIFGINTIGLERKGFPKETIEALKSAYRILFNSKMLLTEALKVCEEKYGDVKEVAYLIKFIKESKRGIQR